MILTTAVLLMTTHTTTQAPMTLTSPAFNDNADIPAVHTCEGKDQSFPLAIANIPAAAKSLAVIVHDPDAPDPKAPRPDGWTHWVLYNLPASTTALTPGIAAAELPKGTLQGKNDWKKTGFRGPCPPIGKHRYVTTVFALDSALPDLKEPDRKALLQAMEKHVLAQATLTGLYAKAKK